MKTAQNFNKKMKKTSIVFVNLMLLTGSLLFISSCTSSDAPSMSSDNSDPLASITGNAVYIDNTKENVTEDLKDFDSLQKELEELSNLEITEI